MPSSDHPLPCAPNCRRGAHDKRCGHKTSVEFVERKRTPPSTPAPGYESLPPGWCPSPATPGKPTREECVDQGGHHWPACDLGYGSVPCTRCGYDPGWVGGGSPASGEQHAPESDAGCDSGAPAPAPDQDAGT